ncbi:UNVERIFIED_CONTAM: TetR/AcrR family transcriptional regulator [Methylobacteriaceae bacterium AG10]|nr:TetR/AcrR family transcriptional regulator [Methylobacteriaceae bacterium AG10]
MDKRAEMIAGAARIFETDGFRGVGVDRLLAPSGSSTRTLYKHFGSRDGLVIAVLAARHRAFMDRLRAEADETDPVGSLFETLRRWLEMHGARGCMLLRARSEYAAASTAIVALVEGQKRAFREAIARRVEAVLGRADPGLTLQVWLLFEGATAAASVADSAVIDEAARAARALAEIARGARP